MQYVDRLMFFIVAYIFLKNELIDDQALDQEVSTQYDQVNDLFEAVVNNGSPEFFVLIGNELEVSFHNTESQHYLLKLKLPTAMVEPYADVLKLYQRYRTTAEKIATPEQRKFLKYFLEFSFVTVADSLHIKIKKEMNA